MTVHRRYHCGPASRVNIQPSTKAITQLGRDADEHLVRLYYLPTPNTNGFTTTHTFVWRHSHQPTLELGHSSDMLLRKPHVYDTTDDEPPEACHLTRVSESERGIVHLARLHISSLVSISSIEQQQPKKNASSKHVSLMLTWSLSLSLCLLLDHYIVFSPSTLTSRLLAATGQSTD